MQYGEENTLNMYEDMLYSCETEATSKALVSLAGTDKGNMFSYQNTHSKLTHFSLPLLTH